MALNNTLVFSVGLNEGTWWSLRNAAPYIKVNHQYLFKENSFAGNANISNPVGKFLVECERIIRIFVR